MTQHEPKEPRPAPTREEFIATLNGFRDLESDGDVIRRLADATKRWQAATGQHGTLPDLGALLAWLLGEIDKAKATDPRIEAWRALDARRFRRARSPRGAAMNETAAGPTEKDWAELRLMRWGDKRRMGWSVSKTPRPCVTCETMIEVGIPVSSQPGGDVLCGPCAASWWDSTGIFYSHLEISNTVCLKSFKRWAEKRSARCRRRKATKARNRAWQLGKDLNELEEMHKRLPELFPPSPEALASWERLCRPKRKGHTLAEIEELKRRGQ